MKKGFTLMEILAVLLVIAVVASFAVPVIRSILEEMRYQKAQVAGAKMGEALRTFYRDSRGCLLSGSVVGTDVNGLTGTCENPALTGVPGTSASACSGLGVEQLFYCDYLSAKDFADLDYTFDTAGCSVTPTCLLYVTDNSGQKETITITK